MALLKLRHQNRIFFEVPRTPVQVQKLLNSLKYNKSKVHTLRSAAEVHRFQSAHCFEAAFLAAAYMELLGYPPLVMSFESQDDLDHVIYVFKEKGRWGSIGKSRDRGLHGRAPRFRTLRELAWSYYEPYIDATGKITAYQIAHLDESGANWRTSNNNLWKAEQFLLDLPHISLNSSHRRYTRIFQRYLRNGPLISGKDWR